MRRYHPMRGYGPMGATRLIQAALARSGASALEHWSRQGGPGAPAEEQEPSPRRTRKAEAAPKAAAPMPAPANSAAPSRTSRPAPQPAARAEPGVPADGTFTLRQFRCEAGERSYKLFVPSASSSGPDAKPRGLLVMLHGCTQDPDDFAAGTRMNAVAERHGLIVAYPAQTRAHNASSCWNWFQTGDQQRGRGEPAILAGIAQELMDEFGLGRGQAFIAGLSAGGAMAVIMAETYPDIFSAVGVHSGLPYQSASNVMSALAAMRGRAGGKGGGKRSGGGGGAAGSLAGGLAVRTIVFHGSADKTVHPDNASGIVLDASAQHAGLAAVIETGLANGKSFTRSTVAKAGGPPLLENWTVEGAGHAWSGGGKGGSYADPFGPDASAEMVRFFLAADVRKTGLPEAE